MISPDLGRNDFLPDGLCISDKDEFALLLVTMLGDSFRDLEEDQKAHARYKDGEKSHIDLAPTMYITFFLSLYTHNLTINSNPKG